MIVCDRCGKGESVERECHVSVKAGQQYVMDAVHDLCPTCRREIADAVRAIVTQAMAKFKQEAKS